MVLTPRAVVVKLELDNQVIVRILIVSHQNYSKHCEVSLEYKLSKQERYNKAALQKQALKEDSFLRRRKGMLKYLTRRP
jgi:hypothetical protein